MIDRQFLHYRVYLVTVVKNGEELQTIVKVDQTDYVDRPNNMDDEEWIDKWAENEYGKFTTMDMEELTDLKYKYLNFEDYFD